MHESRVTCCSVGYWISVLRVPVEPMYRAHPWTNVSRRGPHAKSGYKFLYTRGLHMKWSRREDKMQALAHMKYSVSHIHDKVSLAEVCALAHYLQCFNSDERARLLSRPRSCVALVWLDSAAFCRDTFTVGI